MYRDIYFHPHLASPLKGEEMKCCSPQGGGNEMLFPSRRRKNILNSPKIENLNGAPSKREEMNCCFPLRGRKNLGLP